MNERDVGGLGREAELRQARPRFEWFDSRLPDYPVCRKCLVLLDRHQPDGERPEKILGTCGECGDWYLLDEDRREVYSLPDLQALQNRHKREDRSVD